MLKRIKCLLFGHEGDQFSDACWRSAQAPEGQPLKPPPTALFTVTWSGQGISPVVFESRVCRRCGTVYARRAQ